MENLPYYFECPGCELTMWVHEDLLEHLKVAHSFSPHVLGLISRIEDLYRHDGVSVPKFVFLLKCSFNLLDLLLFAEYVCGAVSDERPSSLHPLRRF